MQCDNYWPLMVYQFLIYQAVALDLLGFLDPTLLLFWSPSAGCPPFFLLFVFISCWSLRSSSCVSCLLLPPSVSCLDVPPSCTPPFIFVLSLKMLLFVGVSPLPASIIKPPSSSSWFSSISSLILVCVYLSKFVVFFSDFFSIPPSWVTPSSSSSENNCLIIIVLLVLILLWPPSPTLPP